MIRLSIGNNIEKILNDKESEIVEFKASFKWDIEKKEINNNLLDEVSETVAAFMNSRGGNLFIGIKDNGEIYGLANDIKHCFQKSVDVLQQNVPQSIKDNLGGAGTNYTMDIEKYEGKKICIIKVSPSDEPIFFQNRDFYVRRGTSDYKLNSKETYEYIKIRFLEYKKLRYEIPKVINPFDERIDIILKIIKNYVIEYYLSGLIGNFDRSINKEIFNLTKIINKFDSSYLPEFIRLPNNKPNYQYLSNLFFNCSANDLKLMLSNKEIEKDKIKRSIYLLSGDLAYMIFENYKKHLEKTVFSLKKIHRLFVFETENNEYFKERISLIKFKEALKILKEYGLISLYGEEYKGNSSETELHILDKLRLKDYVRQSSISFLINKKRD